MKRTECNIMTETVSDSKLLRAKRSVAAVDGYQKAKRVKSERRSEIRMINEALEIESSMTDEEVEAWNNEQEIALDRAVGFGTPVLV